MPDDKPTFDPVKAHDELLEKINDRIAALPQEHQQSIRITLAQSLIHKPRIVAKGPQRPTGVDLDTKTLDEAQRFATIV